MTDNKNSIYSLREYFEGSSDLYCELDQAGVLTYVSQAWTPTLGYSSDEIVGKNFAHFLHPDDVAASNNAYQDENARDKGHFRNRYRHKNGKYRTLLWTGRFDPKTNIMHTHARDVTDETFRSSMLARVAAVQDFYMKQGSNRRDLFETVLHEILRATGSDKGFIGEVSENPLSKKKFLDLYAISPGLENENVSALTASIIESGHHLIINERAKIPKPPIGEKSSIKSYFGYPLFYLGELIGIFGVVNRYTGYDEEFKNHLKPVIEATASVLGLYQASKRENALRERFMVVVENLPIMLTEFGTDGRIIWANRFFYKKTGLDESALKSGVLDAILMDENEQKRATDHMLSGSEDWEDFNLLNKNGESFPSTWTNVRLKNGRAIGIGQDMTDRRIAESKLIQSSKMASLGEMSAGVSHEINNPLAIIQGSAFRAIQNLKTGQKKSEQIESDLNRIIENCQRIASIVRGLRAFSRSVDHEPFIPTPLSVIVDDVMNLAQERFKSHNIRLHVESDRSSVIDCRPVQLVQVLTNLLNNAFDAVAELPEGAKDVWLSSKLIDGDRLEIAVEDSGRGIAGEFQDRILEPFFTTKEVGKGTGLGLSISKGLIDSHNGRLWLDTKATRTRFVIELPVRQDQNS